MAKEELRQQIWGSQILRTADAGASGAGQERREGRSRPVPGSCSCCGSELQQTPEQQHVSESCPFRRGKGRGFTLLNILLETYQP